MKKAKKQNFDIAALETLVRRILFSADLKEFRRMNRNAR